MTHIYEWFHFPKVFSVICPNCDKESNCSEVCMTTNYNGIKMKINSGKFSEKNGEFVAKLNCTHCGFNKEHQIIWPKDAYWKFNIKGEVLWAWSIDHSKGILEYIISKDREQSSKYGSSFYHIPKHFKLAKNRDAVVKKIRKAIIEHQKN